MSALLVAAGTLLLWPVLVARHGRGLALSTLVALVFGTVVYGLARSPSWEGAAAFAFAAALVRLAWGRADADRARLTLARPILWIAACAVAAGTLAARGAGPEAVLDGLFSSWSGLLFWSPVLWLGFWGCLRPRPAPRRGCDAARPRDARAKNARWRIHSDSAQDEHRRIHFGGAEFPAAALGPVLLVTAAVAAVTVDFGPYRGARFAPVLPLLALGLARALEGIRNIARHRPLLPVAVGIALLVGWNALLMAQYRDGRIPRDDTVTFTRIASNAAATVSATVGSPTAWPANWIFAARHGVSAARFDLLAGVDLFGPLTPGAAARAERKDGESVIDVGHLPTDEALLQGGWSVRHPCGIAVCRAVEDRAELVAPIRDPRGVDVVVVAEGAGTLVMAINGVPVLEAALASMQGHSVRLPRARFRSGLNAIVFTVAPGGRALVDRIVFTPVDG